MPSPTKAGEAGEPLKAEPGSVAHALQRDYAAWFARLEAVAGHPLDDHAWTGRWFDGLTPEDALAAGPDEDAEDWL